VSKKKKNTQKKLKPLQMQHERKTKMMTRKDYVSTAEILNNFVDVIPSEIMVELVEDFVEMFQNDNPNFNYEIFLKAVTK